MSQAQLETELQNCCVNGDLDRVRELIEVEKVDINCATSFDGWTPLHLAANENHKETVEYLLEHSADMEKRSNDERETPLLRALSEDSLQVAAVLLRHGADPNAGDYAQMRPLLLACYDRQWDFVPVLLEHGADAGYYELNSTTPLQLACTQDAPLNCISTLLEHGANVNAHGEGGATPLHFAALKDTPELAQVLIDNHASVNLRDGHGLTPLHWAVTSSVARLFLSCNADPKAQAPNNKTPMHTGVEHDALGMIALLLSLHRSRGEDVSAILLERDGEGRSLLHLTRTVEMAKLVLEERPQTDEAIRVCHELLVSKTSAGFTVVEMEQQHAKLVGCCVYSTHRLIRYVQSYNQPLTLPASSRTTTRSGTQQRPTKKQRFAVSTRPNLQGLNRFQRMIAVKFLVLVRDWIVPSTSEEGEVVYEKYLPEDLKYAIMGFLSPLDLMKRAKGGVL